MGAALQTAPLGQRRDGGFPGPLVHARVQMGVTRWRPDQPRAIQSWCAAPNIGLSRRLHVICYEMVSDLATHRVSGLQRIAEMNAAPDAHLLVLLGHLRKAFEFA